MVGQSPVLSLLVIPHFQCELKVSASTRLRRGRVDCVCLAVAERVLRFGLWRYGCFCCCVLDFVILLILWGW